MKRKESLREPERRNQVLVQPELRLEVLFAQYSRYHGNRKATAFEDEKGVKVEFPKHRDDNLELNEQPKNLGAYCYRNKPEKQTKPTKRHMGQLMTWNQSRA
ncbi:hypothetical protein CDL15_Pgr003114 [Punica granatum]|uniref:Uncharacterized protein n=1 Tax=Punica granatum TaxID=22663 RepID=A0A218X1W4_PUNGR|nr:hypothetical protein CDL15_Pgr003114 [Punica granatum]